MQVNPNVRLLTWFNFFTDFKLYAPVAILYFAQTTGSFALGMSIFSVATISSAVLELPTGVFSDLIGRRKTMILGAVASVMYATLYAVGGSVWILALGAVFDGLSQALYSGNNDALLHDTLAETGEEAEYDEFLGRVSAMFQAALAVSALLGSVLAQWSFPLIMWLSVIPQLICLALSFKIIEPKSHLPEDGNVYVHLKEAVFHFIHNKKLRIFSLASIWSYALGEAAYTFQAAFYASLWPVWAIGAGKMSSNILATVSFHFAGRIIKRHTPSKIMIWATLYNRLINLFAVAFPTVLSPLLMTTGSLFFGVTRVARTSIMQKHFRKEQRATMGSLNSFGGSLLFGIVALVLGLFADAWSPQLALLVLQIAMWPALLVYWYLDKTDTKTT